MSSITAKSATAKSDDPGFWIILSLAIACGVTVANIYYAQPLIGSISETFHLDISASGLIVTTIQLGYVAGLFFLVPLGDLIENKKLILVMLGGLLLSLLAASHSTYPWMFVFFSVMLGLMATATQILVPVAGHLAPERIRGKVVGTVVSGLLFGVLLARPVSTLIGGTFGWQAMYNISATIVLATIVMLVFALPTRRPQPGLSYAALIGSLWNLILTQPILQRRSAYQAFLFCAFTLFWTTTPLLLSAPPFSLGHVAISGVLLSGAAGIFLAPIIGHLGDRGHSRLVTGIAIGLVALCFVLVWIGGTYSVVAYVLAGVAIDAGLQANLVIGQRAIFTLGDEIRSRLNAIYLATSFLGGALGSAISGFAVVHGGSNTVGLIGLAVGLATLAIFLTEYRTPRQG